MNAAEMRLLFSQRWQNRVRMLKKFTEHPNGYDFAHEPALHLEEADVITSQSTDDPQIHYPVLDIDIAHQYYESTSPGHGHIYFDQEVSWRDYKRLLKALARAGIIEEGYAKAALDRGYTSVRVPWRHKGQETING